MLQSAVQSTGTRDLAGIRGPVHLLSTWLAEAGLYTWCTHHIHLSRGQFLFLYTHLDAGFRAGSRSPGNLNILSCFKPTFSQAYLFCCLHVFP